MFDWCLKLANGHELRFKSMIDAIHYAEHSDIKDCTIEGPMLTDSQIIKEIAAVERAGINITPDCFLGDFDGKVN